jgi:hypothetical protein
MHKFTAVTMPHGFESDSSWIRQVYIRQLNGHDEQYLADNERILNAFKTTFLLGRVARFEEDTNPKYDVKEIIRRLTIGDRIALLLYLRGLTYGNNLQCVITCPKCKEIMSLNISIPDIISSSFLTAPKAEYEINVEEFVLKIRPLNGADLESIIFSNYKDRNYNNDNDNNNKSTNNKAEQLIRSCIISSNPQISDGSSITKLGQDFFAIIGSKLEEIDPLAEIFYNLSCPCCHDSFRASFNAEDFVLRDIQLRKSQLEREVHWLAFNYHWNEETILSLPVTRRRLYVELINKTLSGDRI